MLQTREMEGDKIMVMAKRLVSLLVSIITFTLFASIFPVKICIASGNIIYVDDSGGANYTSIQDAIDAATEGDTIVVYSGTYNENIFIDKSLSLISYSSSRPVINGQDNYKSTIEIMIDSVTVSGFEIHNTISNVYNGIAIGKTQFQQGEYDLIIITDCYISDAYHGILMKGDENNINNCEIKDNSAYGIIVISGESNEIHDNTIRDNQKGINLQSSSNNNEIYSNTISYNHQQGIEIVQSSNNKIYHNHFINNDQNARDPGDNDWDDGYPSGGNHWDDYTGTDDDKDGIGDIAYDIPGGDNQDRYPLGYFVNQDPVAYIDLISPNPANYGTIVEFKGRGVDDGTIIGWEWRSNRDGILSNSQDFSSSSLSVGTHVVKFRVKDDENKWSSYAEETLIINSQGSSQDNNDPIATIDSITPNPASYGETVSFIGHGSVEDGEIIKWKWSSSIDGILGYQPSFTKSDLSVGTHTIYFLVMDNGSKWSEQDIETLIIEENSSSTSDNKPPIANAGGAYTGCIDEEITFNGSISFDEDGSIINYLWDFGDGQTGAGEFPTHTYTALGNYTITLTVTDNEGINSTDVSYVIILQSSGQSNNKGFLGIQIEVPFPIVVALEFLFIISIIGLFLIWIKRK